MLLNKSIERLFYLIFIIKLISAQVFGQDAKSSLSFSSDGSYIKIPSSPSLSPSKEITIECWIKPNTANWSNKPQTILSKTKYSTIDDFRDLSAWQVFDATNVSGQHDAKGFVGAVFDGRYIYYSPWWKGGDKPQSGKILRYDTYESYESQHSWSVYDAENED